MAKAGRKPSGSTQKDRKMQEIEAKALEIKREEAEKKRQKYQYELNHTYVAYPREIQLHALMGELSKTLGDTSEYLRHYQEIIKIVTEHKGKKFWGMNGDAGKLVARCYEEAHFALAPFFFHYFLVCMEWDYDPSMKFYANRFCVMKDWAQELQKLEDGEYDILGLSAPPRTGKAQPLYSKILTPDGWTTMGEIHVGDEVIAADGFPCKVTDVFPQGVQNIYRVWFDDNTYTDCVGEHLWTVYDENREKIVVDTNYLRKSDKTYTIPNVEVDFYGGLSLDYRKRAVHNWSDGRKYAVHSEIMSDIARSVGYKVKTGSKYDYLSLDSRKIAKIEYIGKDFAQCIMVDHPEHLYVTDDFILTHNSGIETLFMLWTAGRHPDKSILFATHTNAMATKVHQDFYNMATDPKRQYSRIFPDIQINSNSEYLWIDFTPKASPNPYKTAYFRGIDGSFAGVLEASNVIVVDDLIKNIEEAMNPARLATANQKYTVDIEQRRTDDSVKELHVATRWSVHDVLSTLEADNAENPRAKFIAVPGLDENGESNFNFPYRPMTKEHFEHLREKMDEVSFECIIQQKPIERDGLVFTQDSLSYYEGILPDEEPDEVVFWADIAFGGGDYLSMPIGYVYGNDVYIHDVVHTNKTKNETIPLVVDAIIRNNVTRGGGEANNGGDAYMADVTEELKKRHYRCLITNQKAPTTKNKLSRILETQVEIKALATDGKSFRLHFLSDNAAKGNEMYKLYMKHLRNFNQSAKFIGRQKDDAADATAGLVTNILNRKNLGGIVTLSRKWLSI